MTPFSVTLTFEHDVQPVDLWLFSLFVQSRPRGEEACAEQDGPRGIRLSGPDAVVVDVLEAFERRAWRTS